jgi:hypothetical protein
VIDFGTVRPGTTLYVPFHTFDSNDPSASVTLSGLATTDIEIYKDGSTTQRASDNGYALLDTDGIDFDGVTGIHGFSVDLADNSTAGFYAAGSQYWIVVASVTVDAGTVNFIAATFRIGYEDAILNTTIATLSTQTSFTLTVGPAEDDALNGMWVCIHDVASAVQKGYAVISDYTGSTKTVTLAAGTTFTAAATDNISVMGPAPLQPIVAARTLDVSSGGEAGVDWANVGSATTTVGLSGTTVKTATDVETDTADIQTRLPAALVSGRMDSSTGAMAANVLTATAINADAFTAAKFAADVTTELQSGLATSAALATVDTVVDAIKAVTDLLPDAGALTSLATQASVNTIDGIVDSILVDTAEIGVAGAGLTVLATAANLATVDTVVDAIKVQTDKLTFTVANQLDANVQSINDVTITGDGAPGTEFGV